jgi:hypothetical protein
VHLVINNDLDGPLDHSLQIVRSEVVPESMVYDPIIRNRFISYNLNKEFKPTARYYDYSDNILSSTALSDTNQDQKRFTQDVIHHNRSSTNYPEVEGIFINPKKKILL